MAASLKILILEDNQSDADLLHRELKRSGMNFISEIVQTREEFENALQNFSPDIILSDYSLPSFDADTAFHIKQIRSPHIPFIIVSGIIGEEKAVELIKNGVTDFTPKDKLFTLSQKIIRALKESEEWKEKIFIAEKLKMQMANLIIANKELVLQNEEKEKWAAELILANKELKKAEEELAEKEFFLKESQRAGNIGFYKINFVTGHWQSSETLDSIFGIDKNYDRSIAGWLEIVHPDDRKNMDEYLRLEVIGKRKSFNKEYRIVRNDDKQTKWVWGLGDLKFDDRGNIVEMIGTIQDITGQKEAEEKISESEDIFRRLFNESADSTLLLDDTGFTDCNQSAVSILGYSSRQAVLNKKPWDISPEKQPDGRLSTEKAEAMIAKALQQGYNRFDWVHTKSDGTEFSVEVMLTPINLSGKQSFYTIWRDISERKKAHQEILLMNEKLRNLSSHLQNIREEERNIIAREIHDELGQQLTLIKMNLYSLLKNNKNLNPEFYEKAAVITESINQTINTIRKIASELHPVILDKQGLTDALLWQSSEFTKRTEIPCVIAIEDKEMGTDIQTNTQVFRIYQEVLTNIIRHANASLVNTTIKTENRYLKLLITDNGNGFNLEKVSDTKSLGLMMMDERAISIGATLKIISEPGQGTSVMLSVPLKLTT